MDHLNEEDTLSEALPAEAAMPEEVSSLHLFLQDETLQTNAKEWLSKLFGCQLPDLPLETLLRNCWVLGRVAEIAGALRQGKNARLSSGGIVLSQLAERPMREKLGDLESYHKLFDDLEVQRDNLVSLGDLEAGRNTAACCRSLRDLQLALHQLGVEGVPEFESSTTLRRSTGVSRVNSIKVAKFETTGSPKKLPTNLVAKGYLPSLSGSSSGQSSPGPSPVGGDTVGSLRRWLPGSEEGSPTSQDGGARRQQQQQQAGDEAAADKPGAAAVMGAQEAAASPGAASTSTNLGSSCCSIVGEPVCCTSPAAGSPASGGNSGFGGIVDEDKAEPSPEGSYSPLSDVSALPSPARGTDAQSPGPQFQVTPHRLNLRENEIFSPHKEGTDSAATHAPASASTSGKAALPSAAVGTAAGQHVQGQGELTPAAQMLALKGPLQFKLSPPSDSKEGSPDGGNDFVRVLAGQSGPASTSAQVINSILYSAKTPAATTATGGQTMGGSSNNSGAAAAEVAGAEAEQADASVDLLLGATVEEGLCCFGSPTRAPVPALPATATAFLHVVRSPGRSSKLGSAVAKASPDYEDEAEEPAAAGCGGSNWGGLVRWVVTGLVLGGAVAVAAAGLGRSGGHQGRHGRTTKPREVHHAVPTHSSRPLPSWQLTQRAPVWDSPRALGTGMWGRQVQQQKQ